MKQVSVHSATVKKIQKGKETNIQQVQDDPIVLSKICKSRRHIIYMIHHEAGFGSLQP